MGEEQSIFTIALTLIPGVGDIIARNLIAYLGSAEAVFAASKSSLLKIPKIGENLADAITAFDKNSAFIRAQEEIAFCQKHSIDILTFSHESYPVRLKQCDDAPLVLYVKGNSNLNASRLVAIVGTRNATAYGKEFCKTLVDGLAAENIVVVSGLAYGIDYAAHRAAVDVELETIGVLGHALDTIYPADHRNLAQQIVKRGALITEHITKSKIDPSNFVTRNRIIAGMCDAVVVVESGETGGALLTAEYAASYNRDVCAVPGKSTDKYSRGCNALIKKNKAALIESVDDLFYALNWTKQSEKNKKTQHQKELFKIFTPEEQLIVDELRKQNTISIDILCHLTQIPISKLSALLFNLELDGVVKPLPGNCFRIV